MKHDDIFRKLAEIGILPVIRTSSESDALATAEALLAGGIPVAEITMTVPNAFETIRKLHQRFGPDLLVGAGTVTDPEACRRVVDAGGCFVVTPVLKEDVLACGTAEGVCLICGALTPSEILSAWKGGADAVKIFPSAAVGGPAYLRMIREPFPHIPLVPTGGITLSVVPAYINAGAALVGVGGDLVSREAVRTGRMEKITARAGEYVEAIRKARSRMAGT